MFYMQLLKIKSTFGFGIIKYRRAKSYACKEKVYSLRLVWSGLQNIFRVIIQHGISYLFIQNLF